VVDHEEPRYTFIFAAATGKGSGTLRHAPVHSPEYPYFVRAELAADQPLVLAAGLKDDEESIKQVATNLAQAGMSALLDALKNQLAPIEAAGRTRSETYPDLVSFRRTVVRGLHSMIDESGAFRASLKAIYYLIWVRDAGFSFHYQAAAGWPHKLGKLCRLILDNPLYLRAEEGGTARRMFGQLIHRTYGKREEDGLYYVVWILFTHWTQHGHLEFMTADDWELIDEALDTVETLTWDADRGLYGEYTADETPAYGSYDHGWDHAIGKPTDGSDHISHEGHPVTRNYDVYFNLCMHSTHTMLAAMRREPKHLEQATKVWPELAKLLSRRKHGIPAYGELLLENGERRLCPHWGPSHSCCVWGLTMPNFAPLDDWEAVHTSVIDALAKSPDMHFVNGICSAMAATDTWFYPEGKLLSLHQRIVELANRSGRYLPMSGAMPEKFNAPEGDLYHDIRPQGFAMGAWLAAWSSLGLRRLPFGLALRPTCAFETIESYPWRGRELNFEFVATGRTLALEINGVRHEGTLQVPEACLVPGKNHIRLIQSTAQWPLWLRSSVQLDAVRSNGNELTYAFTSHGLAEIRFTPLHAEASIQTMGGSPLAFDSYEKKDGAVFRFNHFGQARLRLLRG
jgi:hypothetical protein